MPEQMVLNISMSEDNDMSKLQVLKGHWQHVNVWVKTKVLCLKRFVYTYISYFACNLIWTAILDVDFLEIIATSVENEKENLVELVDEKLTNNIPGSWLFITNWTWQTVLQM